ncbi:hypothetical protein L2737_06150 [Shewanella electrodiphila]|uniref:Uncharacterized protein n=1 Tax=Shewanella electrodiphila TaxID=934143 RepID=A0ABT0KMT3_9GAMM|nr:hypothetical protein [Shewanella electrodiphila]MCL1044909.1 hypothetical protein [Shewanella electrodiphila]
MQSNRRDNKPSVDTFKTFENMDVFAEPTGMCLRRVLDVSAHKPAAGNGLDRSNGLL